MNQDKIRDDECNLCSLHEGVNHVCLIGSGDESADWMMIGEGPGKDEDLLGKPFVGEAGRTLKKLLDGMGGISRDDVYITNVCKCRPPENRTPTWSEIKICRPYLIEEIENVRPKNILCLGASAVKSVVLDRSASLKRYRQTVFGIPEFPDIRVYASYHPAARSYDRYVDTLLREDFNFAFGKGKKDEERNTNYILINSVREAWKEVNQAIESKTYSLDFETTGLDHFSTSFKLLTVSISYTLGQATCIALDHPESKIPKEEWKKIVSTLISEANEVIGHNIKYDMKCAESQKIPWKADVRDTLIEFHLLDENYPSKSLYALKKKYNFPHQYEDEVERDKIKADLINQPLEKVAMYNCEDADATFRLARKNKRSLRRGNLQTLADFQMEAVKMLVDVEMSGFSIDFDLLDENMDLFLNKMGTLEKRYGGINLKSPDQKARFLYDDLDLPILKMTEKGERGATDKETLKELLTICKRESQYKDEEILTIKDFMVYGKLSHFYSHFLNGLEEHISSDEKIHVSYNMARHEWDGKDVGTVTGRLSCSLLHQIPRDTEELVDIFGDDTIQIKEMFISRFKNGVITQADYSQIELRLIAEYSKDKAMIADFVSGLDIHAAVTNRLVPIAPRFYTMSDFEAKRKATKQVNFGIIYLISEWGLAKNMGISKEIAGGIIRSWFKTYPGVKHWIERTKREAMRTGEVSSLIGRVRRVPGASTRSRTGWEKIRQGVNGPIQGLASDMNVMAMIEINNRLKKYKMKSKLIGNVHDSSLTDTHPKEKAVVYDIVEECYLDPGLERRFGVKLEVPIDVDILQNETWSKEKGG